MGEETPARKIKKSSFIGVGCLIQAVGLASLFGGVLMMPLLGLPALIPAGIIGLALLIYGGRKAIYWVCSDCGYRLPDRNVRVCAVCKARFHN